MEYDFFFTIKSPFLSEHMDIMFRGQAAGYF